MSILVCPWNTGLLLFGLFSYMFGYIIVSMLYCCIFNAQERSLLSVALVPEEQTYRSPVRYRGVQEKHEVLWASSPVALYWVKPQSHIGLHVWSACSSYCIVSTILVWSTMNSYNPVLLLLGSIALLSVACLCLRADKLQLSLASSLGCIANAHIGQHSCLE